MAAPLTGAPRRTW